MSWNQRARDWLEQLFHATEKFTAQGFSPSAHSSCARQSLGEWSCLFFRAKWCRTSSATNGVALRNWLHERRGETGCAHSGQQSCPSAFPRRRTNLAMYAGTSHGFGRTTLLSPASTSLDAQNNQFAASCCQLWVCRLFCLFERGAARSMLHAIARTEARD